MVPWCGLFCRVSFVILQNHFYPVYVLVMLFWASTCQWSLSSAKQTNIIHSFQVNTNLHIVSFSHCSKLSSYLNLVTLCFKNTWIDIPYFTDDRSIFFFLNTLASTYRPHRPIQGWSLKNLESLKKNLDKNDDFVYSIPWICCRFFFLNKKTEIIDVLGE